MLKPFFKKSFEFSSVFLPFYVPDKQTFFSKIKDNTTYDEREKYKN